MPVVTVRNIPDETHRAIKARAHLAGRSTEAEIRFILDSTVRPASQLGFGSALHALSMQHGGFELRPKRDQTAAAQSAAFFA
jgi:plasmid stability protein